MATVNTNETGLQSILLFIESEKELKEGLGGHLKKHLPAYMIPKEIVRVSLFPRISNGKTDRKALINQYLVQVPDAVKSMVVTGLEHLPIAMVYDYPTARELADFLRDEKLVGPNGLFLRARNGR